MNFFKKFLVFLLLFMLLLPTNIGAAPAPKLNYTTLNISTVDEVTLKVLNTTKKITWSSSNKDIIKVNSNGKVTPMWFGTATVSAKIGTKTLKCKVNVLNEDCWTSSSDENIIFSVMTITKTKSRVRILIKQNGKTYSSGDMIAKYSDDCYVFLSQGKYNISGAFTIKAYKGDPFCVLVVTEADSNVFESEGLLFDIKTENS